jgi:hypothetical protein
MPFIAPGDLLYLQAAYSEGALSYAGVVSPLGSGAIAQNFTNLQPLSTVDAVVDRFGNLKKTDSWNLTAAFLHYWTPQVRQGIYGSYGRVDFAGSLRAGLAPLNVPGVGGLVPLIGSNLIWSPVRDLDIGVEVLYQRLDPNGRVANLNKGAAPSARGRARSPSGPRPSG